MGKPWSRTLPQDQPWSLNGRRFVCKGLRFRGLGLAILLHVGSPRSKEGDDRMEAKIDAILAVERNKGDELIKEIDEEYEGRHADARFIRLLAASRGPRR